MKRETFQKKRRPTGGGLFVFHSKTRPRRRKKQRVAAGASGADLGSEVPNLGVARALFVILVLHVAAIAAIFIHNRVTDSDVVTTVADSDATTSAAIGAQAREELPVVQKGEDFYFVATGDTYERIARLKGVDANALRDLNNNMKLRAGRILRIPAVGASAPPAAVVAGEPASVPEPVPSTPPVPAAPVRVAPAPAPAVNNSGSGSDVGPIVVRRASPAPAIRLEPEGSPTRVRPNLPEAPASDPEPAPASGTTYTIKKGDTAWGISRRHKVSVDSLLKANGITDARKLRPGMKLAIPAS